MIPRPRLRNLWAIRQGQALSQEALAKRSGVAASSITRLETGQTGANPKYDPKASDALGVHRKTSSAIAADDGAVIPS